MTEPEQQDPRDSDPPHDPRWELEPRWSAEDRKKRDARLAPLRKSRGPGLASTQPSDDERKVAVDDRKAAGDD